MGTGAMRPSRFNVSLRLGDGSWAVYNTVTGTGLAVPADAAAWLAAEAPQLGARVRHASLVPDLVQAGMLVRDDLDELLPIRYQARKARFSDRTCSVVIVPTKACNLGCYYCSQRHTARAAPVMTPAVAAAVLQFTRKLILSRRSREKFTVSFYGGEPLLAVDTLVSIMAGLRELEAKEGLALSLPVVTNGVLLPTLAGSPLLDLMTGIHVTLDGWRPAHDEVRRDHAGGPTYDRILEGIALACSRGRRVGVRLHVNRVTEDEVGLVLDDLAAAGLSPEAGDYVYFNWRVDMQSCANVDDCQDHYAAEYQAARPRFSELLAIARRHRIGGAFNRFKDGFQRPRPTTMSCAASSTSQFVVDGDGTLNNCLSRLDADGVIGLLDAQGRPHFNARYYELMAAGWWTGSVCSRCAYLPICAGGCPLVRRDTLADCELRQYCRAQIEGYLESCPPRRIGDPREAVRLA
jgi:uncharacterized protein